MEDRLKGKKVPPKYRDRAGNTWAGRGAKPRWLVAAIKEGKKLEDFAVEKTATAKEAKKKINSLLLLAASRLPGVGNLTVVTVPATVFKQRLIAPVNIRQPKVSDSNI